MTDEDLRKRGIEYLLSHREKEKQPYEFTAKELAPIIGIVTSSVYEHMAPLVKEGIWGTRDAFDPATHKNTKVWWLVDKSA